MSNAKLTEAQREIMKNVHGHFECGGGPWLDGWEAYRSGEECRAPSGGFWDEEPWLRDGWVLGWKEAERFNRLIPAALSAALSASEGEKA